MKRYLIILLLTVVGLANLQAQDQQEEKVAYKGQLHVSGVSFYEKENRMHLRMKVTYNTDLLNRGEMLYVTPVLRSDNEQQQFPSMEFDGQSRKLRVRNNDVIVVADESNGNFNFTITLSTRYHDWMQEASLCFLSEERNINGTVIHYDDCLFDHIEISSENKEAPGARSKTERVAAGQASKTKGKDKLPSVNSQWSIRTNLLYDAVLLPNIGIEYALKPNISLVLNAGGNWLKWDRKHYYWRMLTADIEGRYWLGDRKNDKILQHKGHHVGVYAAVYRYDLEFGGKGQMGDFNIGGGVSYGYSLPIGRRLSLDLSIGIGFVGGKYKKYEPRSDGRYYWLSDEHRAWFGPTKAEVTLVWHLPK